MTSTIKKEKLCASNRERYNTDPEYRAKKLAGMKEYRDRKRREQMSDLELIDYNTKKQSRKELNFYDRNKDRMCTETREKYHSDPDIRARKLVKMKEYRDRKRMEKKQEIENKK
jgi:hypothetical protein